MNMNLNDREKEKNKMKKRIGKRIRRITLIVLKPFLPFIIVILGIILAVSTVADALFGKEDDAKVAEKLSSEDYEAQYAEWVDENYEINGYGGYGGYATIIEDGKDLVPTDMFIWPIPGYTTITSHFGMRIHPVSRCI